MKQSNIETPKQTLSVDIPTAKEPKEFAPPEATVTPLSFGATLWNIENTSLPVIVLHVAIPGGSGSDSENWGRASIASEMLTESVGEYDALSFSDLLYQNAIDVSVSTGVYDTFIHFSFHKEQLDTVLPLLKSMLFSPQFTDKDWERVRTNQLNDIRQGLEDAPFVASQYDGYFLYGAEHAIGIPSQGTVQTVRSLSKKDVSDWHQSRLIPSETYFSVVGDVSSQELTNKLEQTFSDWKNEAIWPKEPQTDLPHNKGILLLDMPDAEQTTIRIFSPAFEKNAADEYAADLAGVVMGGSFTSRLNAVLRTEKGYTYGISARFIEERDYNYFVTATSVQTKFTVEALSTIIDILQGATEGYSEQERQKARSSSRSSVIELSTGRKRLASQNLYALLNGEAPNYLQQDLERSRSVSLEDMKATAQYFDPNNGIVLLIGDSSEYEEKLKTAGFNYTKVTLPD